MYTRTFTSTTTIQENINNTHLLHEWLEAFVLTITVNLVDYQQVPASLVPVPEPVGPYQGHRLILQTNHIPRETLPLRMELNTIIPHKRGTDQYGQMTDSSTNSLYARRTGNQKQQ